MNYKHKRIEKIKEFVGVPELNFLLFQSSQMIVILKLQLYTLVTVKNNIYFYINRYKIQFHIVFNINLCV